MTTNRNNLKDKIIEDLRKTGFLKELELARILSDKGWRPHLNQTYLDKDINTNREIDVVASKKGRISNDKLHLWVNLVIECKKTKNPWVIISNSDESSLNFHLQPGWSLIHGGEKYIDNGGIFPPRLIDKHLMRGASNRIGSAFHDSFKEPRETSKIFQSIMAACKAAVDKSEIHGASKEWEDYEKKDPTYLTFYHPIVVVDGPLYEAHLNDKNELTVDEVDWIPVTYNYSSRAYSEYGSTSWHCDIVSFKFFEEYLMKADNWLEKMNIDFVKWYNKKYT